MGIGGLKIPVVIEPHFSDSGGDGAYISPEISLDGYASFGLEEWSVLSTTRPDLIRQYMGYGS